MFNSSLKQGKKQRKEVLLMAEKSNMPYLAIVVLVAVVAVVVLVLNARPSSEEAVAGEATSLKTAFSEISFAKDTTTTLVERRGGTDHIYQVARGGCKPGWKIVTGMCSPQGTTNVLQIRYDLFPGGNYFECGYQLPPEADKNYLVVETT